MKTFKDEDELCREIVKATKRKKGIYIKTDKDPLHILVVFSDYTGTNSA